MQQKRDTKIKTFLAGFLSNANLIKADFSDCITRISLIEGATNEDFSRQLKVG